jgi:hypothetical protein
MSNARKATRPQYKRAPVTVGMSIQQESVLYGRNSRRKYYL